MKALMTLGLVCGFTVLTGADALAKPGKGATSTIKTEKYSGEDIERGNGWANWNLEFISNGSNADGSISSVTFQGIWGQTTSNLDFCWKRTDQAGSGCWRNRMALTDSDGNWIGQGLWFDPSIVDESFTGLAGMSMMHVWSMSNDELDAQGYDTIECGVEYEFKIDQGILADKLDITIPCADPSNDDDSDDSTDNDTTDDQEDDEEEIIVEECTECPFGGTFDGTGCYVGTAPNGWSASISGNYFSFGSYSVNSQFSDSTNASGHSISNICLNGTRDGSTGTLLRDGSCGLYTIPAGVDAFTDNNGWYYDPVCE